MMQNDYNTTIFVQLYSKYMCLECTHNKIMLQHKVAVHFKNWQVCDIIKTHGVARPRKGKVIAKNKTCDELLCVFNTSKHFHHLMS